MGEKDIWYGGEHAISCKNLWGRNCKYVGNTIRRKICTTGI
jgi:hypothetical protein